MYSAPLAVFFALASALTIAWGTVVRHRIAEEAPTEDPNASPPIMSIITKPLWWLGTLCALGGYGLQVLALAFGTLLIVQPILVLSLMFTLPLSARYTGRRISMTELVWAAALTVAVAIVVILGKPLPGDESPAPATWVVAIALGAVVLTAAYRYAHRQIKREKALILGTVTGAVFGYVALFSKATVDAWIAGGIQGGLMAWQTYALIIGAIIGTAVQQASFSAGSLNHSLPAMTITEPIVAFGLSYAVLGERFQVHGIGWVVLLLAMGVMIISTIQLSRKGVD